MSISSIKETISWTKSEVKTFSNRRVFTSSFSLTPALEALINGIIGII